MNLLHELANLLHHSDNLGSAPTPTPRPQRVFVPASQYHGTNTGYESVQASEMPQLDVTQKQPAFAGGYDLRQINVPNVYTHPAPRARYVMPPPFQRIDAMPGTTVPFDEGPGIAARPPRMVNVWWSPVQVPYEQSFNPPKEH